MLLITLTSCGQKTKTLTELSQQNLIGIWQQEGYGKIIEITDAKTIIFDICQINCNESEVMPSQIALNDYKFSKTSDTTLISLFDKSYSYYNKIEKLPILCTTNVKNKKDLSYNFEVLWQTFNEHYAFFEKRDIDWNALKTKYKSQINKNTTKSDLLIILHKMINELKDGHSYIQPPNNLMKKFIKHYEKDKIDRRKTIFDSLGVGPKMTGLRRDILRVKAIKNYIKDLKTYNFGTVNYGLINNDVALLQINDMEDFANYNIPDNISILKGMKKYEKNAVKSEDYSKDIREGTSYIMDKVMQEIKDTKICIIDLRFNEGGYDGVLLEILKRFATKKTIFGTKKAKKQNGYTKKQPKHIEPTPNAYKGKVYILTSYLTASAAEVFVLGTMAAIPDAIRIGSNTSGAFSHILNKKLPNGWEFGLSNEIAETPDGKNYEAIGIAPHYKIAYPKNSENFMDSYWFLKYFSDNNTGKDSAIEKVFELEKQ